MPRLVGGQQHGHVPLAPHVAGSLDQLCPARLLLGGAVARLLVSSLEVADHPPAAVSVDAARCPFGEDDGEDVEAAPGVTVEEVADRGPFESQAGPGRDGIGCGEQRPHGGDHLVADAGGIGAGPGVDRRGMGPERVLHGCDQCFQGGGGHERESSVAVL